jgi:hypothetical protein
MMLLPIHVTAHGSKVYGQGQRCVGGRRITGWALL